ncbi:uncharacterized protein LOC115757361 [Rhodamnia argentea]|uniref:Uncharacterized protein LOC115757361 n=1 Tax=Rhodamnia argentea TaxID=178133 RepID=A0A8B8R4L3_9MYRT|nr:uncharacterized protein LOC115757361 [Rhodamnia argentea]
MSAIVCGKRSFFEELSAAPSPVVSKRIRCSSSPVRLSPPRQQSSSSPPPPSWHQPGSVVLIEELAAIFPDMDKQLLERALEESGNDLDSAIRRLNELRLGSADPNLGSALDGSNASADVNVQLQSQGGETTAGEAGLTQDSLAEETLSIDGPEWVELFVREMMSASNMDDAKARAARALEALEKSILARVGAEASRNFHQENMLLKQQVEALIQENTILKRAVAIQHERQKEHELRSQELQHLKQVVSQYQEQLRTLEVNNYALTMHLKQAQQSSSIPGRFHPDVF